MLPLLVVQQIIGLNREAEILSPTILLFHKRRAPVALVSLSGRNPAMHFHVCELLDVLSALWRCGDRGNNVLQAQEHGEEQYEKDSQKC